MTRALFSLLIVTQLMSCAKSKIIARPTRLEAPIIINGQEKGKGVVLVGDAWGTYQKLRIEAGEAHCREKKVVSSRFMVGSCLANIAASTMLGLGVGISIGGLTNEGAGYGALSGLALGGILCPIFSWKLPKKVILDVSGCEASWPKIRLLP